MNDAASAADAADANAPAQAENAQAIAPVKASERIETLDFIRGIAVMGILAANIVAFGQPFSAYTFPSSWLGSSGDPDGWMWIAQFVLIDGKMRGLFTLLFGAGLYLFMERTWARGGTRWRQAWRLLLLLGFGYAHLLLLWGGDILTLYGIVGLVVILLMRLSPKSQFAIGAIGYLTGALMYGALFGGLSYAAGEPLSENAEFAEFQSGLIEEQERVLAVDQAKSEIKLSGNYGEFVAYQAQNHAFDPFFGLWMTALETLPLMLFGMVLYRIGFFSGAVESRSLKRWGWIGFAVGGALHLVIGLWVQARGFAYYDTLAAFFGYSSLPRLMMVMGLAALLVAYSPGWTGWLAERVRAAGRAAFSNYLGTSILMLFVFHGWALGLFGELSRPQLYIVTALACVIMLAWSKPWLDRFRYGPLEWLWRCLTYRKLFPLSR